MSQQHLIDALERYQEYEEYAQKLMNILGELVLSDNDAEVIENSLDDLGEALSVRITEIGEQLEAINNEPLDRFRRRDVS